MSIQLKSVSFSYGKRLVLDKICMDIAEKEMVGIIGPNGGGKTSLLHLCAGYLTPTSGVLTLQTKKRYSVGFVPQNIHKDRSFPITTLEIVLSAFIQQARPFGSYPTICLEKSLKILEILGLLPYKETPFGNLSTGLAQRVLLARALVDDPEILLLDEPTSSVDPKARNSILDLIFSLKGSMTILFVTHDLEITTKQMDKVFWIEETALYLSQQDLCKHCGLGLYRPPFPKRESS